MTVDMTFDHEQEANSNGLNGYFKEEDNNLLFLYSKKYYLESHKTFRIENPLMGLPDKWMKNFKLSTGWLQ